MSAVEGARALPFVYPLVRLPERRLLHLAHGVARQLGGEQHALGLLVFRQPVGERRQDRRLVEQRLRSLTNDRVALQSGRPIVEFIC